MPRLPPPIPAVCVRAFVCVCACVFVRSLVCACMHACAHSCKRASVNGRGRGAELCEEGRSCHVFLSAHAPLCSPQHCPPAPSSLLCSGSLWTSGHRSTSSATPAPAAADLLCVILRLLCRPRPPRLRSSPTLPILLLH